MTPLSPLLLAVDERAKATCQRCGAWAPCKLISGAHNERLCRRCALATVEATINAIIGAAGRARAAQGETIQSEAL